MVVFFLVHALAASSDSATPADSAMDDFVSPSQIGVDWQSLSA